MISNKELQNFLLQEQVYKKFLQARNTSYNITFEHPTGRILLASRNPYTVKKVSEFALNTGSTMDVKSRQFTAFFDLMRPYNYIFDRSPSTNIDNPEVAGKPRILKLDLWPDDENLPYYALVAEKGFAIDYIMNHVGMLRRKNQNTLLLQSDVYIMKVEEAKRVLELGLTELDDNSYFEFPFVHSYAEIENFSLKESAEEILLHHSFYKSWLASTESLRQKFNRQVVLETNIIKIPEIVNEFINQSRPYGQL